MIAFDKLDLNLIRVFDAVMEEHSVLRASQRLHLSQSAVSHALSRLREGLGQEIFVRTGKGMTPTSYAIEISGPLRAALLNMSKTLTQAASPFEPEKVSRSFVIAANDYISATLLPQLNHQLSTAAPGIDLQITPATRLDLAEQIDLGRIDVAIGTFRSVPERFRTKPVLFQDEVFICSGEHPIGAKTLQLQDLTRYPLAVVSLGGEGEGVLSGYILERGLARQAQMYDRNALEQAMAEAGLSVRRQIVLPHFLALPMLLEKSELLAIMPQPLARTFARTLGFMIKPTPYAATRQQLDMIWHSSNDNDPAQRWLHSQISAAADEVSRLQN
ncbi:LysR family transcriptional regulator [Pseudomonas agarici]|uniref:LysR family transcriptional regulator n=1 Tax=Pseudomonas agarici TaxID=46677 RepID=A0A0X1SZC5_PSEAA|nr:LysR substrate-binding domain-containing protein [Pseudomonas agarici]AMB85173.1 LysR family transcriptional regulator [Pseudomonas agarici]NWB94133.1 LysR family transcriptional regulator [Pseudomonas agarici]NWC07935.1 LysR family transcriptional regulator [Pseudomonas agarici]SEK78328.1 transcriptional regulator, LysR family [Pseudomonas agarici]